MTQAEFNTIMQEQWAIDYYYYRSMSSRSKELVKKMYELGYMYDFINSHNREHWFNGEAGTRPMIFNSWKAVKEYIQGVI